MADAPAKRPCGSCPYRQDVPSGVWDRSEYEKLPRYDRETFDQPAGLFLCHQQDGRLCAGWVAVHDMTQSLAVRMAVLSGTLDGGTIGAVLDYTTDVPLWPSGEVAAAHGLADLEAPSPRAARIIARLQRKVGAWPPPTACSPATPADPATGGSPTTT